jgi:hypothetical protein
MKSLLGLLLLALLGASAAFLKPMRPVQVQTNEGAAGSAAASTYVGLDNPGVVEDPKITPARKCA